MPHSATCTGLYPGYPVECIDSHVNFLFKPFMLIWYCQLMY